MKVAIIYYSMSGNTKYAADKIEEQLKAGAEVDRIEIHPVKAYPDKGAKKFFWGGKSAVMGETPELEPYDFDADNYDMVIIGTPVWASNCAPPIRTFLTEHAGELKGKKLGMYVCYSGGGAEKAIVKMKKCIGTEDGVVELSLIDPQKKPEEENMHAIADFCKALCNAQ